MRPRRLSCSSQKQGCWSWNVTRARLDWRIHQGGRGNNHELTAFEIILFRLLCVLILKDPSTQCKGHSWQHFCDMRPRSDSPSVAGAAGGLKMPALPGNCQIRDVLHLGTFKLQSDWQRPHSSGVSTKDIKLKSLTWDLQKRAKKNYFERTMQKVH